MQYLSYVAMGFAAGIASGAFGIGGGTILIPIMIYFFGLSQHQAQGTSLGLMLPPVFILAVWRYFKEGHVLVPMALWGALGLSVGALIGAHFVQGVADVNLKRAFGVYIILIGLKMVTGR